MADKKSEIKKPTKMNAVNMANVSVTDAQQPKFPIWFGIAMTIGPLVWLGPAGAVRNTLLPQYFSQIDPSGKVQAIAVLATVTSVVAAIANVVFGALSDLTRSRMGKRKPWILFGSLIQNGLIVLVANLTSIWSIVIVWGIVAAAENAVASSMVAQQADRIAPKWRGTVSTFWALGYTANNITGIIAAQYLGNVKLGMYVLAGMGMVLGILHVLLTNEKSNVNEPREPFNWKTIWEHFAFPTAGSHDYWFAVAGKFCSNMGGMLIGTYLLYILTDYIKMNQGQAGKMMAMYSTITLIGGLIFNAISGPIADKMGRLKLPVAVSVAIMGIAQLFPFFDAAPWTIYVFAIVSSIASGIYGAVDGALNLAVLPNKETAGKDMGFLNLSNTLSQIAAAWVASGVVLTFGYKAIFPAAFLLSLAGAILTWRIKAVK